MTFSSSSFNLLFFFSISIFFCLVLRTHFSHPFPPSVMLSVFRHFVYVVHYHHYQRVIIHPKHSPCHTRVWSPFYIYSLYYYRELNRSPPASRTFPLLVYLYAHTHTHNMFCIIAKIVEPSDTLKNDCLFLLLFCLADGVLSSKKKKAQNQSIFFWFTLFWS